jgi:hypothetical protein
MSLAAACTTSRIEGRASAEPSAKIETLALLFDDTGSWRPTEAPRPNADTYTTTSRAPESSRQMAILIRERFPRVFAANGVELEVYNASSGAERWTQEAAGRRHVLYLMPYRQSYSGMVRMNTFTMRAELRELQPFERTLWTGITSVSRHDFASVDEKTADELAGKIVEELKARGLIGPGARTVAAPAPSPPRVAPDSFQVAPLPPRVDNVDAVPLLSERGREGYREWLTKSAPRAFVIAEDGSWYSSWGRNPKEASDPQDPAERAIARCERRGRPNCKLYALDNRVVWKR